MPALKTAKPKRDHLPITTGCQPQWQLDEVGTDDLIAELCRRNYYGGTTKAPTRPCCGQPVKSGGHKPGCKAEAEAKARQDAALEAMERERLQRMEQEAQARQELARKAAQEDERRTQVLTKKEQRALERHAPAIKIEPTAPSSGPVDL